jgi:TonB family protein
MAQASKLTNLATNDIKPWHIKASFQLFDEHGTLNDEGTYEEFWAGPTLFKRNFTGRTFAQIDYGTEKGVLRAGLHDDVSSVLLDLRREFVAPLPTEQAMEHERFDLKEIDSNGLKLSCFTVIAPAPPPGLTYCVNEDSPILRITAFSGLSLEFLHNRILRYQDRAFAGDLKIVRGHKPLATAHVDTIEAIDPANSALFAPSSDAVLLPRRIDISAGVAQGLLQKKSAPIYPKDAGRVTGTVVLDAVIGTDGRLKSLRVVNGPPPLQQPAYEAVRTWIYKPYLVNAEPVEVHTTINVIFSLS